MEDFLGVLFIILMILLVLAPTIGFFFALYKILKDKYGYKQQIPKSHNKHLGNLNNKKKLEVFPKNDVNGTSISIADELIKLKEMLDNGLLSQGEFQKLKNDLLSK